MKFSIIVTTNRSFKALRPLFTNTHKESELIIIDSNYNWKVKECLRDYQGLYQQIVYAPVLNVLNSHRDLDQGLNTALSYAENEWIVRADDLMEFKSDFFSVAEEDISRFRRELNSDNFIISGQKLRQSLNHKKWTDPFAFPNIKDRYIKIPHPSWSFFFGLVPLKAFIDLNGYDIKYDLGGWGYEDHNILNRLMRANYLPIMDRKLMGFSTAPPSQPNIIEWNKFLYDIDKYEIENGKIRAFNPYNILELRDKNIKEKDKFIIK